MMKKFNPLIFALLLFAIPLKNVYAKDGYKLWQNYELIEDKNLLDAYRRTISELVIYGNSATFQIIRSELKNGLDGLLGITYNPKHTLSKSGSVVVGTLSNKIISDIKFRKKIKEQLEELGKEGYIIASEKVEGKETIVITAQTEIGVLYGAFHFLRLIQTNSLIKDLSIVSIPKIKNRILNHWDNLDRTVERGYAGFSLWDWHKLPEYIDQRYIDYARANASIGINGTVLTNVNANALILTEDYLVKVKALADVFRPYGLKVYLTARFSAPIDIGGLETADPLNANVQNWWNEKAKQIYSHIPDFGGFLVKANSEGQPGPQNYGRTHADGANMLADAVGPYGGIVMWRAFVYDNEVPDDRAKQAYNEFKPLDGKFRKNVMVQVKNGAIDFQPREPFHPLFGAMIETPLMMEFQITQEYLGQGTHLAFLSPMYKETLKADTYAKGEGSTVAKSIDGTLYGNEMTGIAGVTNVGTDRNWTGHHFGQANWFTFGRLAWDHTLSSDAIATEWIKMTFTNQEAFLSPVKKMMLNSHEAVVNYMTPLGLHHLMGWSHHYGPGPWIKDKHRADWTSVYYHQADSAGIGFDRTASGSNAVAQYFPPVAKMFSNLKTCPEKYLLWFHHLPWNYKMNSGNKLWDELCYKYDQGVKTVQNMQSTWNSLEKYVDKERFNHVKAFLKIQEKDAREWRDACILYFQTFSSMPLPPDIEEPEMTLEYYMNLDRKYVPGI